MSFEINSASTNSCNGLGSLGGANSSVQSQIIQMIQQLENAIHQLLARIGSGDDNNVGGSPSGAGSGSGGGMPQLDAQQPAATGGGAPAAAATPSAGAGTPSTDAGSGTSAAAASSNGTPAAAADDASTGSSGSSGSSGAAPGAAGISNNAGGVPQAAATSGVSPDSVKVVNTGTGDDKTFNVTNDTNRPESFTYSVQGQNKGTITLQPGQTGSFKASSADIGVRISPSDANGNTKPNEVLYEDGGADNGQGTGAGNPDISKVDGNKDFGGNASNMTVTMSDGGKAGDGDAIHAYAYSTDDAASMGLAGNTSKTANIVMSNA
ncbi:hypothetical protein AB4851_31175 [Burkholderia sp. 22PA0099]|uniref:hypothetical protein n=1 Tax=Burkholderia sp. 22PA0099 TaxID=3237372 RepID=UPI0039C13901